MRTGLHLSFLGSLLAGAVLSLAGCADDGPTEPTGATSTSSGAGGGGTGGGDTGGGGSGDSVPVSVQFEGRVGDEVFSCSDTYEGIGVGETTVELSDFRLYIHDLRLRRTDGELVPVALEQDGLWQYEDVVLLDFEDKSGSCKNGTAETNGVARGTAPAGDYDGLSFKVGVPSSLNHGDFNTARSPLNLSALHWGWGNGYKFVRIDTVSATSTEDFFVHVGSVGCAKSDEDSEISCSRPNVPEIALEGFDPLTTEVLVDVKSLLSKSDVESAGCMSMPEEPACAPIFEQLGLDIADGSPSPEQQQAFFRVE